MTLKALLRHEKKLNVLVDNLKKLESLVVAFSGGVDSTFLLKVAQEVLGEKAAAVTVHASYIADWEVKEAVELARSIGVSHRILSVSIPKEIENNPVDRCYLCKKSIFNEILYFSKSNGYAHVVDGSNADDLKDYRPGMRALKELEVKSPLLESGLTKEDIRRYSKRLGLPTWDKPPYACLLTRLPHDTPVLESDLELIEKAEAYLIGRGIRAVRVRKQGDLARIEVGEGYFEQMLTIEMMQDTAKDLKKMGFAYVTLDMNGYQMGSFNPKV